MVDALEPAAAELKKSKEEGVSLLEGMKNAVTAAKRGMKETVSMEAKRGRSQYLREKSVGHQDAGATSTYFCLIRFLILYLEEIYEKIYQTMCLYCG